MKNLTLALAILFVTSSAHASPRLACSYKGSQLKFAEAVKADLRQDILSLKEKGIPVVDSSISLQSLFYSQDPTHDPAYVKLKGNFKSETGTFFQLAFDFFPRDGFLGTPKDLVGFYSRLQYDQLDPEGNPVNGHCLLESDAQVLVKNVKTGATVATFGFSPFQVN